MTDATVCSVRPEGMALMISLLIVRCWMTFCTSTVGVAPETVTVSSSEPTRKSALTFPVKFAVSSMPSLLTALKPGSANVTVYVPGRRPTTLYSPLSSVTTVRTFSISAGLAASTVTPGNTAPDESLTTPAIPLLAWAREVAGIDTNHVADSATANHTLRDSLRSLISVSSRASGSSATLPDPAARQARSGDH